jgi:hypothetical protein
VIQNFETTPTAQFPEDLATALVGPVFKVYEKKNVGSFSGIKNTVIPFVLEDVSDIPMWSESQNRRVYNRFPVRTFLDSDGTVEVEGTPSSAGVMLEFGNSFDTIDHATEKRLLQSYTARGNAWMPIFSIDSVSAVFTISGNIVTLVDGAIQLKTSHGIVSGLPVYVRETGPSGAVYLGDISDVISESSFSIGSVSSSFTAAMNKQIYIGFNPDKLEPATSDNEYAFLYDKDAKFVSELRVGDVIKLVSHSGSGVNFREASVRRIISDNLIQFHVSSNAGEIVNHDISSTLGQSLNKLFGSAGKGTAKNKVTAYGAYRLVGFTKKYDTDAITSVTGSTNELTLVGSTLNLSVGDIVKTRLITGGTLVQELTVTGIKTLGSVYYMSADVDDASAIEMCAWKVNDALNISSSIYVDYRCVKTALLNQVLSKNDPGLDSLGVVHPRNDLAMMASIISGANPNRNFYFVPVNPIGSEATAYADALEKLTLIDVYHVIAGSEDAGVQNLLPGHVLAQSDPYEAHERICTIGLNEEDVYLLAAYTGSINASTGVVTCAGADFYVDGVSAGDEILLENETIVPVLGVLSATTLSTAYRTAVTSRPLKFLAGSNAKKAVRAGANLGAFDERRVTAVFPCSFTADFAGERNAHPSFYLSCAVAGEDSTAEMSQSQTKGNISVGGFSNIELGTNFKFRKSELDTIGGAGVYIFTQGSKISSTISCRHDLTTDMSALEYKERSITKQADKAAKFLRSVIDPYVGRYNISDDLFKFLNMILGAAAGVLTKQGIVKSCSINSITRDPDIADKVLINVTIIVYVAGNYYEITLNVRSR